ncbi:conjugal transfer protein [Vibrio phage vB_ValP_IME271]|nr:conjugal transfer protein [Vibrio phage vB_ValP_IME271]
MIGLLGLFLLAVVIVVAIMVLFEKNKFKSAVITALVGLTAYFGLSAYIMAPMFEALMK